MPFDLARQRKRSKFVPLVENYAITSASTEHTRSSFCYTGICVCVRALVSFDNIKQCKQDKDNNARDI